MRTLGEAILDRAGCISKLGADRRGDGKRSVRTDAVGLLAEGCDEGDEDSLLELVNACGLGR
jgi:hypothetical protein